MIRWAIWLVATVMLGLSVHLAVLLTMPSLSSHDALSRAIALGPEHNFHILPRPTPESAALPLPDPSILTALCRYDLAKGPLQVRAPVTGGFFSVSFYTPDALNFYALNDKAATRNIIELKLYTSGQLAEIRSREGPDTPESLRVEAPLQKGIIALRALVQESSQTDLIESSLKAATCSP